MRGGCVRGGGHVRGVVGGQVQRGEKGVRGSAIGSLVAVVAPSPRCRAVPLRLSCCKQSNHLCKHVCISLSEMVHLHFQARMCLAL